jgi:hypothetical protein
MKTQIARKGKIDMILPFKKIFPWGTSTNFEEKILNGIKKHTFREDKKGRWKPGVLIHFATGVRTIFYNCFMKGICKSTQSVQINYFKSYTFLTYKEFMSLEVVIDGNLFYKLENGMVTFDNGMIELAKNDGFDSREDFFKWFDEDFEGKIIHWTDLKY